MNKAVIASLVVTALLFPAASKAADEAELNQCIVSTVDPHPACTESSVVIDTVQKFNHSYTHGDLKTCADLIDVGCTTFDDVTKKLIVGKEAVLNHMKEKWAAHSPSSNAPLNSFIITAPYAEVTGETATVTYVAVKKYGGEYPAKFESHITTIYVKKDGHWLMSHYKSNWKRVS
jgi:Calcium/calmodulin dependent protein kinase II association domain